MRSNDTNLRKTTLDPETSIDETIGKLRDYAWVATGSKETSEIAIIRALNKLLDATEKSQAKPGLDYHALAFQMLEKELRLMGPFEDNARQKAFVLTEIEGLSSTDAAQILGLDPSNVSDWTNDIEMPDSICPSCLRPWAECGEARL